MVHGLFSFPEVGLGGRDGTEAEGTEDPIPVALRGLRIPSHAGLHARLSKPTAITFTNQNSTAPAHHCEFPVPQDSNSGQPLTPCSSPTLPQVLHSSWTRRRQGRADWEGRRAEIPHHVLGDAAGFAAGPAKPGWHPLQGSTGPKEAGQRSSKVCPDFVRGWKPHSSSFRDWPWKCPSFC